MALPGLLVLLTLQQPACSALKLRRRSCVWRACREQLQATRGTLALTDGSGPEVMLVKSGDPVTFEAISRRGAKVWSEGCAEFCNTIVSAVYSGLLNVTVYQACLRACTPGLGLGRCANISCRIAGSTTLHSSEYLCIGMMTFCH